MTEHTTELDIGGASCASCVKKIETALAEVEGVSEAHMNFAERSVAVTGKADVAVLIKAIEDIGYSAATRHNQEEKEQADNARYKRLIRDTLIALGFGIPLMIHGLSGGDMGIHSRQDQALWLGIALLTLAVMIVSGGHFYHRAWKALLKGSATMDTLIALGTGSAWLYSLCVVVLPQTIPELAQHLYFEACAMIIGFINLGLALELKASLHTGDAIKKLMGLQAKTARVINNDQEHDIPIKEVREGDLLRIRPGEKIPVDANIVEGQTHVDESMLTGEPMPVSKNKGDLISAGSINNTGSIVACATAVGEKTALSNIIQMVRQAQNSKPAIARTVDKIASYFVPGVVIIALLSAVVWLSVGPNPPHAYALVAAATVLIIACPCALGLATPMSVMVGVGKAAEFGVLIRRGDALQTASRITTMVFDKTGTLTLGAPQVSDIVCIQGCDKDELMRLAGAAEKGSEHPLARAILDYAQEHKLELAPAQDFNALSGLGISVRIGEQAVLLGNKALLDKYHIDLPSDDEHDYHATADKLASEGKTPIFLAADGTFVGIICVEDPIKEDSKTALEAIKRHGIRTLMLTGDNKRTAAAVAKKMGIDEVIAEVLPDQKASTISSLQAEGEVVAMVGDGINDAPALASADVGFAIGTGTDIAMDSADITLMRGSLTSVVDAINISHAILKNIKQNLFGAFIYNILGIPLAAGLLYPLTGTMLSPVFAAAAMALSSVTVVSNANRLRFFTPD